jgi:DNA-binding GntR family transcriptional regulator
MPKASKTLLDQAHQLLEEMIVTLKLPPGSQWSEGALSKLAGIGRTPVREAVQKLAAAHLMEIVPRHGVMVSKVNSAEQLLVLETRRELERLIATLAARRASPAERAQLPEMAAATQNAGAGGDVIGYVRSLFVGNRFLAQCSRNPYAFQAIAPLHTLSERFYYAHHVELNDLRVAGGMHADVMRAIAAADEAGAGKAADRLMDYIEEFTRALIVRDFDSRQALGGSAKKDPHPVA